jgi:5-methylcytosine-specific restriction endonuclease McrA
MPGDPFYLSPAWRALRSRVLKAAGWRCAWCRASVHKPGAARVDHIRPRRDFPDLALVQSNLRVLCHDCDGKRHAEKGGKVHLGADASGWPTSPGHPWNRAPR